MYEHISVRQWQERFKAGTLNDDARAGWDGVYDPLNDRGLQRLVWFVILARFFVLNWELHLFSFENGRIIFHSTERWLQNKPLV